MGFSLVDFDSNFPHSHLAIDKDVTAAALAEARMGPAVGLGNSAHITIGTGIGGESHRAGT